MLARSQAATRCAVRLAVAMAITVSMSVTVASGLKLDIDLAAVGDSPQLSVAADIEFKRPKGVEMQAKFTTKSRAAKSSSPANQSMLQWLCQGMLARSQAATRCAVRLAVAMAITVSMSVTVASGLKNIHTIHHPV